MEPENPFDRQGPPDSTAFDFFFSFRSPYSYLALPQIAAGLQRYGFLPRMRIVLPIAVRIPGFFKTVNPLWPPYLMRDTTRIAEMLSIPYRWPRPDPIVMDLASGEVAADQPYIYRVSRLGVAAAREGKGFQFVKLMATAIWSGDVTSWHADEHVLRALTAAGLDAQSILAQVERNTSDYDSEIACNQEDQVAAGHWGVPLFVYRGEPFLAKIELSIFSGACGNSRVDGGFDSGSGAKDDEVLGRINHYSWHHAHADRDRGHGSSRTRRRSAGLWFGE